MKALEGEDIFLVSQSAEDLNLSFVVPEKNVDVIVSRLHEYFFPPAPPGAERDPHSLFGATWDELKERQGKL